MNREEWLQEDPLREPITLTRQTDARHFGQTVARCDPCAWASAHIDRTLALREAEAHARQARHIEQVASKAHASSEGA
jgi:hypothetical protein